MRKIYIVFWICILSFSLKGEAQNTGNQVKRLPGIPGNEPLVLIEGNDGKSLKLEYSGAVILKGNFSDVAEISSHVTGKQVVEQHLSLKFTNDTKIKTVVYGSTEAIAAETRGDAQETFPLVRTSHGLSNNLRNNAIYDRQFDWMLEAPEGTEIQSFRKPNGLTRFEMELEGKNVKLVFRPRYYQKHKNITHFQPWNYRINKESITGWCSWWAYFRKFTEEDHLKLLDIWEDKHFSDYGYRYVQIDDVYQGGNDHGRENSKVAMGYLGGRPTTWLDWRRDVFPGGLTGYVEATNEAGFDPGIWLGSFFSDVAIVEKHPDWFVKDEAGNPAAAPFVSYAMDATNPEVVQALIRPTFKGLSNAGVEYVKIDQLRHYLYDNLHNNLEWCRKNGIEPDEVIRAYLRVAREELGDDTFILACWGVLPEAVGLADACRIGGDGYGPVTLQQYNSWNGIVWRNDPDHCDVAPSSEARDAAGAAEKETILKMNKKTVIRPALASIAGAMLMLSDKPEVYKNDYNLLGIRRSAPVLFSVPGQLYDFDPVKTDWLKANKRTDIKNGKTASPIDGDKLGHVCPFWLNEFNTSYENWFVLHRLNWVKGEKKDLEATTVKFVDLGLDPSKEYLVYEFWSDDFLGVLNNEISLDKLSPYGLESLAIREKLNRPQLVSTNRHLSQGAAEIEKMYWEKNTLKGRSKVVVEDTYIMTLFVPDGFTLDRATIDGEEASTKREGNLLKVSCLPEETTSARWSISFKKMEQ